MKIVIPSVASIISTNKFCSEMNGQRSVCWIRERLKVHSTLLSIPAQNHFSTVASQCLPGPFAFI